MNLFDGGSIPLGHPDDASVLLGEQSASKTDGQGSNPCARALPTWLDLERRRSCKPDHAGANPVVGPINAVWVCWMHRSLRNCGMGFDSLTRYYSL